MDGSYFYWFLWIGWVITTFIMKKSAERFWLSLLLLLVIILSTTTLHIEAHAMNAAFLLVGLISYLFIGKYKILTIGTSIFFSFLVSFVYIGIHLLIIYDPIWILIDRVYLISIPIAALVLTISKPLDLRLSIVLSGVFHGELGYSIFMNGFAPGYIIGSIDVLDIIAISCMSILIWWGIETMLSIAKQRIDRPISHLKGKAQ
ncbi:YphA family membrane protein [Pseudalkalibacillus decolorationis]|uniref:YphA family membrane protein n=1 Tax=Pseudalkalibacillus decolorationis TaxID=163879 RepID=UPI00214840DD|nr:hypothetical protein [Pseudalkalibacillus decolorationis]